MLANSVASLSREARRAVVYRAVAARRVFRRSLYSAGELALIALRTL